jgi:hypothetical protein
MELPVIALGSATARAHTATSWFDARYKKGSVVVSGQNRSIVGNRVESVATTTSAEPRTRSVREG